MMVPTTQRFELKRVTQVIPQTTWFYVLLFCTGYYWFVVHGGKGTFAICILILLILMLIHHQIVSKCVLQSDETKLKVEYRKGPLGLSRYSMDYLWTDLVSYAYKSIQLSNPDHPSQALASLDDVFVKKSNNLHHDELQINWENWSETYFSGKDVALFAQYMRVHFPDKEVLPMH